MYSNLIGLSIAFTLGCVATLWAVSYSDKHTYVNLEQWLETQDDISSEDLSAQQAMNMARVAFESYRFSKGFQYLEAAAEKGLPHAIYRVGYLKSQGFIGADPSGRSYVEDFQEAANLGSLNARFVLDVYDLLNLVTVPKGFSAAHRALEKHAQQGNLKASHMLCAYGKEEAIDTFIVGHHFRYCYDALDRGYAPTQYIMGRMYQQDPTEWPAATWAQNGLEQDMKKAMALYEASAAQGYDPARQRLQAIAENRPFSSEKSHDPYAYLHDL